MKPIACLGCEIKPRIFTDESHTILDKIFESANSDFLNYFSGVPYVLET